MINPVLKAIRQEILELATTKIKDTEDYIAIQKKRAVLSSAAKEYNNLLPVEERLLPGEIWWMN